MIIKITEKEREYFLSLIKKKLKVNLQKIGEKPTAEYAIGIRILNELRRND